MIEYEEIFIGTECNNNCTTCEFAGRARHFRSLEETVSDIRSLDEGTNVMITGGEPALYPHLGGVLTALQEAGAGKIKIRTNARPLSDWSATKALAEAGILRYEVKVSGSTPWTHDTVTRAESSFEETTQGLQNIRSLSMVGLPDPFVTLRVSVGKRNYKEMGDIVNLAVSRKADRLVFVHSDPGLPMSIASAGIADAIEAAIFNGLWVFSEGIPLCLMQGHEHHVLETVSDLAYPVQKAERCPECVYSAVCNGIAKDYLSMKGPNEFLPVTQSVHADDIQAIREEA